MHGDLLQLRIAALDLLQAAYPVGEPRGRNWLRRVAVATRPREAGDVPTEEAEQSVLSATPAADATLSTAATLAGEQPVGSHHLLLAALTDANSAAARVLASLGVDLTRAKDALHNADIAGTSDELPEEAGRRQMNFQVTPEVLTIVATDETLVKSASAALTALGEQATSGGVIRGADLTGLPAANLAKAWTALHDALSAIATRAGASAAAGVGTDTAADTDTGTDTDSDSGTDTDSGTDG
ncbi:MAG TPA: Clp protease N-terminal domain-containing protein [Trebonia sp.]|nr:Clp protease N-terminal domain-containing protein [Trebonia sp.]